MSYLDNVTWTLNQVNQEKAALCSFLATLVALHLTPVSQWVSGQSFELA